MEEIYDFWFSNKKYWIPITDKEKEDVDKIIYEKFYTFYDNFNINSIKDVITKCIYIDQMNKHFLRHILRNKLENDYLSEEYIIKKRIELCDYLEIWFNKIDLKKIQEEELIFLLMPFKHIKKYKYVLTKIQIYCSIKKEKISKNLDLSRFFNDTCKKYFTNEELEITKETFDTNEKDIYNPISLLEDRVEVCEYYPEEYCEEDFCNLNQNKINHNLFTTYSREMSLLENIIRDRNLLIVSLSGGVDSMVTLYLLTILMRQERYSNIRVVACHIIYGNRKESLIEYDVIREFCYKLKITLYSYKIEFLRREEVEREFYEKMTREIRFMVYKNIVNYYEICDKKYGIFLGHIKEDVIENIWSNIAKCQHIFDLKKMTDETECDGVIILRPFLTVNKEIIIKIAHEKKIPYLKNTTPSWSNRGKFRERFYRETHIQYGKSVDEKILELSEAYEKVGKILDKMIYNPIIESYRIDDNHEKVINVSKAIEAELDISGWQIIFERICHEKICIKKPSIHSIKEFIERIKKFKGKEIRIQIKKDLQVIFYEKSFSMDKNFYMKFID